LSALDYLLKPVDPDDLIRAVERLAEDSTSSDQHTNLRNIRDINSSGRFEKLAVSNSHGVELIELDSIIRLESDNNYTNIFLEGKEKPILVSKTLKHFERALENSSFLRVHQSHLINASKIQDFDTEGGGVLRMTNRDEVSVSRSKRALVKSFLSGNNLG
jgi:two-component system LytT family response regulator